MFLSFTLSFLSSLHCFCKCIREVVRAVQSHHFIRIRNYVCFLPLFFFFFCFLSSVEANKNSTVQVVHFAWERYWLNGKLFDIVEMKARSVQISQFSGSYLNKLWTRRFILGSLLQNYDPRKLKIKNQCTPQRSNDFSISLSSSLTGSEEDHQVDKALLRAQRVLSEAWNIPVKMMDALSEQRIYHLLTQYACCEGQLSVEALSELQTVLALLPGAPRNIEDPRQMECLLYALGYAEWGDNFHRVSYSGQLHYSPEANMLMSPYLSPQLALDGGDVYDSIRVWHVTTPGYAIDSATTSEVDDAIGVEVDPTTGEEWFSVFVSDATVYCPYDSGLEQVTARSLTTTTYLPEGVFFMLPKPIVEAATLRDDKPCRTFTIRFQIDHSTGELKNYSIDVGWLQQLRRITYEQVEPIINSPLLIQHSNNVNDEKVRQEGAEELSISSMARNETEGERNEATTHTLVLPPPSWLTEQDEVALRRIYAASKLRFSMRMQTALSKNRRPIEGGLPDPYIKVQGTDVISVQDQILSTQAARLAVAEMMIAANEVCSRIAEANSIPIPFRGTRPLSSYHETAQYFEEPQGVTKLKSLDASQLFVAEAMQDTLRQLTSVTRAMYHSSPLYHAGLLTSHYTHSTSPLRRYPDMLVHHQLKVWLYHQRTIKKSMQPLTKKIPQSKPFLDQFVPEYIMANHCATVSMKQERSAVLQDKSTRYWILRYMEKVWLRSKKSNHNISGKPHQIEKTFLCYVGETKNVSLAPEYGRFCCNFEEAVSAIGGKAYDKNLRSWRQEKLEFTYVSHIYIPELQLTHTIHHDCSQVRVGAVIECRIVQLCPVQGVLEMSLVAIKEEGDERYFDRILQGGIISHIDT